MLNITLVEKILTVSGEKEENIIVVLEKLGDSVNDIFAKKFILYINDHVDDDTDFEEFAGIVEKMDNVDDALIEKLSKWMEEQEGLNFDEFWENFEEEVRKLEEEIIKNVKDSLDESQKKEIIDFIYEQKETLEEADEKYLDLLQDIANQAANKPQKAQLKVEEQVKEY